MTVCKIRVHSTVTPEPPVLQPSSGVAALGRVWCRKVVVAAVVAVVAVAVLVVLGSLGAPG